MKKNILFVIWSFSAGGGAEKILANIVNNMDNEKYNITILEYVNFGIENELNNKNVKVLPPIIKSKNKNLIKNISYLKKYFLKLQEYIINKLVYIYPKIIRRMFIKNDYDIEIAFNYLIPTFLIADSNANLKIAWNHGSIENLAESNMKSKCLLQKKSLHKVDKIIAISDKTSESIKNLYPEVNSKIVKISNGYDFKRIKELSQEDIEFNNSNNTIIAIGRLDKHKNFDLLIESAKILNERRVDFNILILGDGDERVNLERKIKEYCLTDKINLLGYIQNPYPYILKSKILCLTSLAEGFPTVIVEGLFLGCPFVSTNVAGIDELSNNGECGIVSESSPYEIANNLEELLVTDEKRTKMSQEGREFIQKYSIENQIKSINEILKG